MSQPIPNKIREQHPEIEVPKVEYILLVDGNSLGETCFHGDKRTNSRGEHYGGIFQFFLQIKILLQKRDFSKVYLFFDGPDSGFRRWELYNPYKSNRDKSYHKSAGDSDYYKQMDEFCKKVINKKPKKEKTPEQLVQKEEFYRGLNIIKEFAQELFMRECTANLVEGDDFIGYFVTKRKENQKLVIVSSDMDLAQLIEPDGVAIYSPQKKLFLSSENFNKKIGYNYMNIKLLKQLCGDSSDCIKGISQLGTDTLFNIIPELKTREVKIEEVIDRVKVLSEERTIEKKKPLKVYENILNQTSNCVHDGNVFEINEKIINLRTPLLIESDIEEVESIMDSPIDPEGRNLENLYKLVVKYGIDELLDANKFANFFSTFNTLRDKEIKYYNKWIKENNN